jgi:hypothetical protein
MLIRPLSHVAVVKLWGPSVHAYGQCHPTKWKHRRRGILSENPHTCRFSACLCCRFSNITRSKTFWFFLSTRWEIQMWPYRRHLLGLHTYISARVREGMCAHLFIDKYHIYSHWLGNQRGVRIVYRYISEIRRRSRSRTTNYSSVEWRSKNILPSMWHRSFFWYMLDGLSSCIMFKLATLQGFGIRHLQCWRCSQPPSNPCLSGFRLKSDPEIQTRRWSRRKKS